MTTPITTSTTDSQMYNNIMATGSRDRPPMLATGRYAQWQSRFLRYIDTRPNGDALRKFILEGPYQPTIVTIPVVPATENSLAVPERIAVETILTMSPKNKKQLDSCYDASLHRSILQQLQQEGEWLRFVTIIKQQQDLDAVSYHTLFDKLKQYQKKVNEIRAERIGKNANLLALIAAASPHPNPYYQAQSASEEESDPKQVQRDKDMQKNLALIAKYFKKIYKPTNNNLRTSSNSRNKNVDTSPRYKNDNQTGQFGNQRTVTVAGARETVGSQGKRITHIKEKLCKQAEKGVPLQAEQADWLEDTDEEIDEQELEAHYSYMAKIQEVPTADSGTDTEPLEQVQNDAEYNVFANVRQHSEQPESTSNTCLVEKDDSNVTPDSPNMCDNDIQTDQNAEDERVALANLIANLKLDVDENKKIQKQLKKANASLAHELKECKSILAETSRTLGESNSIRDSCLIALQNKQTEFERYVGNSRFDDTKETITAARDFDRQSTKVTGLSTARRNLILPVYITIVGLGKFILVVTSDIGQRRFLVLGWERYKALNDRTVDYDKLEHKLNETLGLLAQKDIDIKEGLKLKAYEISVVKEKHDELVKQSLLTKSHFKGIVKEKTKVITDLKLKEEKVINKMISMEKQLKFLNETVYKRNQTIQTIHMLAPKGPTFNGRPTFANPMYLKKAQSEKPCMYEILNDQSDPANRLVPDREETLTLEKESRSKLNKDLVRPYDYTKLNSLYEIFKPTSQEYHKQLAHANEVRKKMWRKCFVKFKPNIFKNIGFLPVSKSISKSKQAYNVMTNNINHFRELVDQTWEKHSHNHVRAPTALDMEVLIKTCLMPLAIKTQNDSFIFVHELKQEMHADLKYVESLENEIDELESDKADFSNMYDILLQECVSNDVIFAKFEKHSISLELALQQCQEQMKNDTVCKEKASNVFLKELEQYFKIQDLKAQLQDKNIAIRVIHKTNVRRPQLKSTQMKDKVVPNNSQVKDKKTKVEDHPRISSISNKTKSITASNDSLKSKTSNVNAVCATYEKCVFNSNHDTCVSKFLNDVNARTKKPKIVQLIYHCFDSGCTKHMAGNLKLLCNFVEKYLGTVHFTNDQFAPILGYRDLVQGNITINRVYYVEGLNHNLFSVGQFCDADLEVAFRKSTCFVRDLQGNDLLTSNSWNQISNKIPSETTSSTPIYFMAKASPTQAWLWHQRLYHLNFNYINLLSQKDVVIGLPKLKYVKDQLYTLMGPLFLKSKDEIPEVLKEFLTMIQRNLQAPVISVRTDRGIEFLNKTLHAFFKEEGIEHQTSTPQTPEQNGVVER
ncbi:retrovirus-related pol polyprotein from transposon TNT 1-94 [Tanacetum coccineum]